MCKNKLIIGDMTPSKILLIPCKMFWRNHLSSMKCIVLLGISRCKVDVCGDVL